MAGVIAILIYGLIGLLGAFLYLVWAYRVEVNDIDRPMFAVTIFLFWPIYLVFAGPLILVSKLWDGLNNLARRVADKKS